jgi:hypothetical protein
MDFRHRLVLRYNNCLPHSNEFGCCLKKGSDGVTSGLLPENVDRFFGAGHFAISPMIDNYHLTREDDSFDIIFLHGHLWGGRFQMAVIGGRQVTGWIGRGLPGQEAGYPLNILVVPSFNF